MGNYSSISKSINPYLLRALFTLGLFVLGTLLLTASSQAQSSRFGPRAGSRISGTDTDYGQTNRRPYRRRQPGTAGASWGATSNGSSSEIAGDFDYRLKGEAAAELAMLDLEDPSNEYVDEVGFLQAGYCDCGDDCCCGDSLEPGCGCDDGCEPGCGCDDYCGGEPSCGMGRDSCGLLSGCYPQWTVGFEWTFLKPRFSQNLAYTTLDGDVNNNMDFTDTEFDYDLELSPRVWVEAALSDQWSWRVSYWQYDQSPGTATTSPDADGFGEITHPGFADVDISTTIPTDTFTAMSDLNAYTIDFEALKHAKLNRWQIGVGGGVRYASAEQSYFAQLRDGGNNLLGQIDSSHSIEGFGPTVSLAAKRRLMKQIQLVCAARGSLLYGDGSSQLLANEDITLTNPFQTTRTTNRDDLLTIGEARIGLEWLSPKTSSGWQWTLTSALEGQVWGDAGNASSENADLGFFGFNVGAGFVR